MRAGAGIDCEGPSRHRPALVPSIAARFRSGEWKQQPHGYQPRPAIEISKLTGVPPAEKFVTAHPEAATRFRIEQSRPLLVRQLTSLARSTFNATLRRAPFAVTGSVVRRGLLAMAMLRRHLTRLFLSIVRGSLQAGNRHGTIIPDPGPLDRRRSHW
jgi:hypothetical protein